MNEQRTASGLSVMSRAVIPRDNPPNANGPLETDPPTTGVGPTSSEGFGNTNVLFDQAFPPPLQAQAWSGWPVEWATPASFSTEWLVQRTSTAGTCADTVGRTVSTFQPVVKRGDQLLDPQPFWTQNPEPMLYASWDEWVRSAINSLLIAGELFVYCTGRNAEAYPVRWVNLQPDHVRIEWQNGRLAYWLKEIPLNAPDVLHVKYQAVPGELRGISPLAWVARNMLTASYLTQFATDLAAAGGVPWAWIKHPGTLNAKQAAQIQGQFANTSRKAGMPAILSAGMELNTLAFSPEAMALLSLREFDEQRVAAGMGVPPLFAGLPQPSGLTYTSTQMMADFFWLNTLKPISQNLANAVSGWALPRGTNLLLDASEYTAPSLETLVQALVAASSVIDVSDVLRRVLGISTTDTGTPALPVLPDPMGVQQ